MEDLDDKYKKRYKGRSRLGPETYTNFEKKKGTTGHPRPPGAWWERVYENGKKIGYWLVLRSDPDARPRPIQFEKIGLGPLTTGTPSGALYVVFGHGICEVSLTEDSQNCTCPRSR
ncbi:hypothetical protein EV421DRAFT_1904547 [Armillaria borealis]|uniref:Uncharacterized protein n=1 Tax=Armillaria borealis TaxID=47425 RepID=A0AA39MP61_9AGAR|nr:hypothetical protein EV421DRAFT_1904547 [Armillaria borealis]